MMKVLIVDAFVDEEPRTSARGKSSFAIFNAMVLSCLQNIQNVAGAELDKPILECCRVDELSSLNYLCDYENTLADINQKNASINFDSIDIIFVGGDSCTSPFDSRLTPLSILFHMANETDKPTFTCGGAALVDLLDHCTGTIFNLLNGNGGCELEKLSAFPVYASSVGSYPSAFFDNETGDLYTYDVDRVLWKPIANTGLIRIPKSGKPPSSRYKNPSVQYSSYSHNKNTKNEIEALSVDLEVVARINNKHLQHYIFNEIDNSGINSFILTCLGQWKIKSDSLRQPTQVLASSKDAPIILQVGNNRLIVAAAINNGRSQPSIKKIMSNFVNHIIEKMIQDPTYELHRNNSGSLKSHVFGGKYGTAMRKGVIPPSARSIIASSLPNGPVKIDAPVLSHIDDLHTKKMALDDPLSMSYTPLRMLTMDSDRTRRAVSGRALTTLAPQNPSLHSNKRLQNIISSNGQTVKNNIKLLDGPKTLLKDDDMNVALSESISDMYSGKFTASELNSTHRGSIISSPIRPNNSKPSSTRVHHQTSVCEGSSISDWSGINSTSKVNEPQMIPEIEIPLLALDFQNTYASNTIMSKSHLPHHSPRSIKFSGGSVMSPRVQVSSPRNTMPYNTYKKYQKKINCSVKDEQYKGQYTEIFLSPREKFIKDLNERKKTKFVGEKDFVTSFGKSTALPLRKDGAIRAHSAFEDNTTPDMIGINVSDRATLRRNEKDKHLAGHWKA